MCDSKAKVCPMFDVSQNLVSEDMFTVKKEPIILKFKSGRNFTILQIKSSRKSSS
jgi:hypothetical protein